ncbi:hypothetical protein UFOVP558_41 [uncultured Caudovirales phage]|uniref:Uncharacterized protein n=1 Tax=uncultured Caudovirales phage TaxID=2100421 RepID=A0A6J5MVG8_9CAUD|nr:hypothetical protein UFOVP558_41 [uncultured Caudovirales phage]
MKAVTLYRVKKNAIGALPGHLPEGMVLGLTESEEAALAKNTLVKDCFEKVVLKMASIEPTTKEVEK